MLKKKLQKALKKAGLSEGLADVINITSEDQIESIVNQLKSSSSSDNDDKDIDFEDVIKSEGFEEFVKEHGFDKVLTLSKTLQSEHDRKVTKGVKTGLENFLKKKGAPSKEDEDDDSDSNLGDDAPDWAKALMKKVDGLEKNNSKFQFSDKVKEAMTKSKLPDPLKDKWASRVVEGDVSIDKQIEALEKENEEIYQSIVGDVAVNGNLPMGKKFSSESEKLKEIATMGDEFVSKRKKES